MPGLVDVYPPAGEEGEPFQRPPHGTSELIGFFSDIKLKKGPFAGQSPVYAASQNLPADSLPAFLGNSLQMRSMIALLALTNGICGHCQKNDDLLALKLCEDCCLVWYCNEECRTAHCAEHKKRCPRCV
jgi:hypothetical protein